MYFMHYEESLISPLVSLHMKSALVCSYINGYLLDISDEEERVLGCPLVEVEYTPGLYQEEFVKS